MVLVFITTTIKCNESFSKLADKQGPAAGVTPVLHPLKPFPSSLFVFDQ
jgi:hypothetical protein